MTTNTRKRLFPLFSAAVATTLFLTACGGGEETEQPATDQAEEQETAESNDADVMFAQMMIPHHEQAVEMSQLAEDRAAGDDVKELATEIEAAQGPEIEQLTRMLESWGEELMADMDGMDHDMDGMGGGMEGMMTGEQMAELEQAEGEGFDTMFLEMMIDHHEGAIDMARTELDEGANPEATELAQEIVDVQEAEIEQMSDMLGERQ
ncbi:DUF305 domain-containing protein [Allosalinactinospora lopnorensis]|uniref:DUF305 domain-containing protein n=1 Tax=Allosalinactinospora lopnorensis TaxID=1352348 RepID=UPI000623CECF|nr:DUF305 domain-containing protein [Allosalinactinospora lopnorensis]